MTGAASIGNERFRAPPEANWGEVLRVASPAIVKVGCEDNWSSGFLIGSDLAVTTYGAVGDYCEAKARIGNDDEIAIEVVAWSGKDNLALVRVARATETQSLRPREAEPLPEVGEEVAILAAGTNYRLSPREWGKWNAPRLRWGRVGAVEPRLVIDAGLGWADNGAPVLSTTGDVVGVVVGSDATAGPVVAVPWSAVRSLLDSVGKQGEFSRPWEVGMCVGVMFSRRVTADQTGAFLPIGVTFDWVALQAGVGFWSSEAVPVPGDRMESEYSGGIELEVNGRYMLPWDTYLQAGVGVQAISRNRATWPIGDKDAEERTHDGGRLAFLSLAAAAHWLQLRVVAGLSEPEGRLEVGLLFGRY